MKTPQEIKQIVTRLEGVSEALRRMAETCYGTSTAFDDRAAYLRASGYASDGANLIRELTDDTPLARAFADGSLVATRHPPQCEVLLPTIHGPQRCPCNAIIAREWPGSPFKEAGMYGESKVIQVCGICAQKEIRWTVDGKAYGV